MALNYTTKILRRWWDENKRDFEIEEVHLTDDFKNYNKFMELLSDMYKSPLAIMLHAIDSQEWVKASHFSEFKIEVKIKT